MASREKAALWQSSFRTIPASAIHLEAQLLNRSQFWCIRAASYAGAAIAVLQYRQSSREGLLWDATLQYMDKLLTTVHPNLVHVLGVATASDDDPHPVMILMDKYTTSLYDLLHVQRVTLSDSAIVHIAQGIVAAIAFCRGAGLRHLTSRKVLLDAAGRVKILGLYQRDILDRAQVPRPASPYDPPPHSVVASDAEPTLAATDVYAFGVLLWEMCCNQVPSVELFGRLAQMSVQHPRIDLEGLARMCLADDPADRPMATEVYDVLVKLQISLPPLPEDGALVTRLQVTTATPTALLLPDVAIDPSPAVATKRLEAVEAQVLEEQRNFDVVVGQLEFAHTEIATLERAVAAKENERLGMQARVTDILARVAELERSLADAVDARDQWQHQATRLEKEVRALEALNQAHIETLLRRKHEVDHMAHQVQQIQHERVEMEYHLTDTEQHMKNEKELSDELSVRWQQTIKRVEEERRMREKAERGLADLRMQNKTLLEQVKEWNPETGTATVARHRAYETQVREKETHIQHLLLEMVTFRAEMSHMEATVATCQSELQGTLTRHSDLQARFDALEQEYLQTQTLCQDQTRAIEAFETATREHEAAFAAVQKDLRATEDELKAETQKRIDQELALKSRRCLDLSCDAPPFLIQTSGYCRECHERREQEAADHLRQLDMERQNQPPDQVVRDAFAQGGLASLLDTIERFQSHADILVAGCKKMQAVCEATGHVKDTVGDVDGFKRLVAMVGAYTTDAVVQLATVRLMGVLAFNHDVNRVRLVAEGGLGVVLAGMAQHPNDKGLQQCSCTTLTNLAHNCEGNRRKILAQDGIERVLDAMQTFPHDCGLQQCCCWALISLAGSDYMCEHIAARGGVGGVVAAMLNCHADAGVQYYGSWALLNLVSGIDTVQSFARQEGAIEVCEAAMACFADHDGIQDKAGSVVDVLSVDLPDTESPLPSSS
ncbi:Aste57867_11708 [Aphanomyces stellatus]|uniref:Aste57867_11708 protein n=1 Tax=Aphanomyces stellatus TaxID=120398 RepID=A0A485KUW3_9STRA|nr:hypothetical protein As57867_011665 [Aphanomyces stellatus]VFT88565.1 Aste57867_11708 [Aphanomyces stellatus]